MKFLLKIFYFLGIFMIFLTNSHAKNYENSEIWKNMISGDFVPVSTLTLKNYIPNPEIWQNDASIHRFVSVGVAFSDKKYRPENLTTLSGANIDQAGRNSLIRADVKPFLLDLAENFHAHFKTPLVAISAFRDVNYQQRLWDLGRCSSGLFCAKPGESEHQLGLTLDFFDATSETAYLKNPRYKAYVAWMNENAHLHGWSQSYQHGPKIDGYEIEPWHWRFVGKETATFLRTMKISYTKFLKLEKMLQQI